MKEQEVIDEIQSKPVPSNHRTLSNDFNILSAAQITVGTNIIFDLSNDGIGSGESGSGLMYAGGIYYHPVKKNVVYGYGGVIGSASAWSWNGIRANVSGTQSRTAQIRFQDIEDKYLLIAANGASVNYSVDFEVWDTTGSSTRIFRRTVVSDSVSIYGYINRTVYNDEAVQLVLQPGRQYVFRLIQRGSLSSWTGTGIAQLNRGQNDMYVADYYNRWLRLRITWL